MLFLAVEGVIKILRDQKMAKDDYGACSKEGRTTKRPVVIVAKRP